MSAPMADKRTILGAHEFFRGLPIHVVDRLAAHARTAEYGAGKPIFAKGDPGHGLLAVFAGLVKISVQSPEGREIVLNLIGHNEVFGEIALLDGEPRTADATAITRCHLLVLDRRDVLPLLEQEPSIGIRLLEVVSRRLRRTSEQVEDLSFEGVPLRLAKALLRLGELQGTTNMPKPRILITQKALGQTVGLSRESINKHLQAWRQAGLIEIDKGACILLDPETLRQLMASHEGRRPRPNGRGERSPHDRKAFSERSPPRL
jgi:CRP/FNR family transcriptional regulator, cyclic AMP receptor protein